MSELFDQVLAVPPHGFVRLVDAMPRTGADEAIVSAARVSYGSGSKGRRSDRGLIHYLMEHRHTTPFEMVELKFHIKAPIFVERQIFRHRTASINSVSGRYTELADEYYEPAVFKMQDTVNRQGSAEPITGDDAVNATAMLSHAQFIADDIYRRLLKLGVSKEQARLALPVSIYTEWCWKIDLHNLFHFLGLRLDAHAQEETRRYAEHLATCARSLAPLAYEAFEEYVLHGRRLSRTEVDAVRRLVEGADCQAVAAELGERRWDRLAQKLGLGDATPPALVSRRDDAARTR